MRVAFLAGHLSRRASGVRQMIEGLSGAIAARGVEITVFGIDDTAWRAGDCARWHGGPARTLARRGPAKFGYMPGLSAALSAYSPDLVHLHGIWMHSSAVAAYWAGTSGRRLVISPHGMLAGPALAYAPRRKRLMRFLFQDRCFARTAGFHATAEPESADIRAALGAVPVGVIPNGVTDTSVARPSWPERARRVVAIGRLHPIKGFDRLLRAWALVEPDAPGWSLVIAGPDPEGYGGHLRRLVAELGLARAEIGPPVFEATRDALIANSRLFALPSTSENFALTVPEALICGTPVLASTGTPWAALAERGCGWWVAPGPDALAAALREAITLPDPTLAAMGAAGRDWALSAFGWDSIAEQMLTFYAELPENRKPRT